MLENLGNFYFQFGYSNCNKVERLKKFNNVHVNHVSHTTKTTYY